MTTLEFISKAERLSLDSLRTVSGSITILHSFETPKMLKISQALLGARYQAEADERKAVEEHAEVERLKGEVQMYRDKSRGDYWAWQGDGEDHLESLTCPVLIQPDNLAAIVKTAAAAEE